MEESMDLMGSRPIAPSPTNHHVHLHPHHNNNSSPQIPSPVPAFAAFYQQIQQRQQQQQQQNQLHQQHQNHGQHQQHQFQLLHHHHHQHPHHVQHPHAMQLHLHEHQHHQENQLHSHHQENAHTQFQEHQQNSHHQENVNAQENHQHSHFQLQTQHTHAHQTVTGDGNNPPSFPPSTNQFTTHLLHAPSAMRPTPSPALSPNLGIHHQQNLDITSNTELSDTSTSTPPQPTAHTNIIAKGVDMPSPDPFRRKRGRPRKYSTDINDSATGMGLNACLMAKKTHSYVKKARINPFGAIGQGFQPHIIAIAAGEDLSIRIMSFLQQENWGMCILSANGAISNVTLCQPATTGGIVTYEGRYDILSLSGSFLPAEHGCTQNRGGGLTVSLAGADGRIIGGEVAGIFVAASPVKVIVGTFLSESEPQGGTIENSELVTETPTEPSFYVPMQKKLPVHLPTAARVDDSRPYHCPLTISSQSLDWEGNQLDANS